MQKQDNFEAALANLRDDLQKPLDFESAREVAGRVALFAICLEQAWKTMKQVLEYQGFEESQTGSPRIIMRLAYSAHLIDDQEGWFQMWDDRNHASHIYNAERAQAIIDRIGSRHIGLLVALEQKLQTPEWRIGE